jgi:hypothetical protein
MHMNQVEQSVMIPAAGVMLEADIAVPAQARRLVLFAHGSGSSRYSSRNRYVAGELQNAGLATVLVDLLTPEEEQADAESGQFRFDIDRLSVRVIALTLVAGAGCRRSRCRAVQVTQVPGRVGGRRRLRGGGGRLARRPAGPGRRFLRLVSQPTLLIVGARRDRHELNRDATSLPGRSAAIVRARRTSSRSLARWSSGPRRRTGSCDMQPARREEQVRPGNRRPVHAGSPYPP